MSIFKKWFGPSKGEKLAQQRAAQEAERARRIQQEALTNAADSDTARQASDRRLRRIGAMRGVSGARTGLGGTAQTERKTLLGS